MFLHADNDGFKLDANHDTPIEDDDLPGLVSAFRDREVCWQSWNARDTNVNWTEKWWFAGVGEIRAADFNLSAGRHRPLNRPKTEHRDPLEILDELRSLERDILGEIAELRNAVRGVAENVSVESVPPRQGGHNHRWPVPSKQHVQRARPRSALLPGKGRLR